MPLFQYKAINSAGRLVRGKMEVGNLAELEVRLRAMQLDLIVGKTLEVRPWWNGLGLRKRVSRRELITFCFYLEQISYAGIPLLEGLSDLRDSIEQPHFRIILADVIEAIAGGKTLSAALAQHQPNFDPVFVNLIHAAESSGRLPEVLHNMVDSLKWADELSAYSKKVMIYPASVGLIIFTVTIFLMLYMVPQLKLFVKNMGQELPLQTQVLFFISDGLMSYGYLILALIIMLILCASLLIANSAAVRYWIDGLKLKIPLIGSIIRKIILAHFASTFALLYASGIPVLDAVRITQKTVRNLCIKNALAKVDEAIGAGQNMTSAFQSAALFPPLIIRMLKVGETTGALDKALANISYFYNRDVKEAVERIQAMIEPALTLFLGGILGWIMLSVLGPVYDVISALKLS